MIRTLLAAATGIGLGAAGMAVASVHGNGGHEDGERVRVLSVQEIPETVDGKEAAVTTVEVTIGPGQAGLPHRHPGPAFGYVVEGEYELGVDDGPTTVVKAGETFYEPGGHLHRVSRNPAAKGNTRLIAVVLHPRDAKEIAVPEHGKE